MMTSMKASDLWPFRWAKLFIFLTFCASLFSCSSNEGAQHSDKRNEQNSDKKITKQDSTSYLIIPGQSVGEIKLNAISDVIYKRWGKPDAGDAAMGKAIATWHKNPQVPKSEVSIFTAQLSEQPPALIKEVRVTDPRYRTKSGISVGSSYELIKHNYQLLPNQGYAVGKDSISVLSAAEGISFAFDKNNRCVGILVFTKGDLKVDAHLKYMP